VSEQNCTGKVNLQARTPHSLFAHVPSSMCDEDRHTYIHYPSVPFVTCSTHARHNDAPRTTTDGAVCSVSRSLGARSSELAMAIQSAPVTDGIKLGASLGGVLGA